MNRESTRIKDAGKKRVLDEAARSRRLRKALEALEIDNYHDDPHADLGMLLEKLISNICRFVFSMFTTMFFL